MFCSNGSDGMKYSLRSVLPFLKTKSSTQQQNRYRRAKPHVLNSSFADERFPSIFSRTKWFWIIAFSTTVCLSLTIAYAFIVSFERTIASPTAVTRNLRILSEGVTILVFALLATTNSIVMWAAVSSKKGVSFSTWLSMSSTIGIVGLFKLFFWPHIREARDWHRYWVIIRYKRIDVNLTLKVNHVSHCTDHVSSTYEFGLILLSSFNIARLRHWFYPLSHPVYI